VTPSISTRRTLPALGAVAASAIAAATLAACGSQSGASAGTCADDAEPVEVTDAVGREVSLDCPATRIVTTEWESTENALALGVTPVGVADEDTFDDWVGTGQRIPEEVENVGERHQPSLEKIAALAPELIIAPRDLPADKREKLAEIAPLATVDPYPIPEPGAPTEWEMLRREVEMMGELLAREEEADRLLADLDATIAEQRERIEAAGRTGDELVIAQAFTTGKPVARLFDDGSQMLAVARKMGLRNGFDGERQEYSITEVGLEGLREIEHTDWLLTATQSDDDPFTEAWAENPAYRSLEVVERNRVVPLGGDTWTWGGPLSAALVAERIADAVTGEIEPL
jgi:ABC-type Fe3+-hydroxamate transport system substrate-binding protein